MTTRRRLHFRELLKRKKTLSKTVMLPRKNFLPARESFFRFRPKAKRFAYIFLFIAILTGAIYFFFFSEAIRAKEVVFYHGKEKVSAAGFIFPVEKFLGKHMFFVPAAEVRREILRKNSKEVRSLVIRRSIPSKIAVRYETFPNVANIIVSKNGFERKFLVNEHGLVMQLDAESQELPYISGPFEDFPQLKSIIIDPVHLASMIRAYTVFTEKFGMKAPTVIYKKTEKEVHLKTERNFLVWIDLTQDIEKQLFKLKRALPKLNIYEESLEYIDLRVSGKTGEKVIFKKH